MLFKEKKGRLHFRVTQDLKLQRNRNGLNCVYTFFPLVNMNINEVQTEAFFYFYLTQHTTGI